MKYQNECEGCGRPKHRDDIKLGDTIFTGFPVCPHCGKYLTDVCCGGNIPGEFDVSCSNCRKKITVTHHLVSMYSTVAVD